jgi:hypothetical protein
MRAKKPFWRFLFYCSFLSAILGVEGTGCSRANYDVDSKAYVDKIAPVIFKDWDPNAILAEADPTLKELIAKHNVKEWRVQSMKGELGSMKNYKGSTQLLKPTDYGGVIYSVYSVDAEYEKGEVKITLTITLRGWKWRINDLTMDTPLKPQASTANP